MHCSFLLSLVLEDCLNDSSEVLQDPFGQSLSSQFVHRQISIHKRVELSIRFPSVLNAMKKIS